MAHERRDEPAIRLRDVAVEKGPDMIAADRPWFDKPNVEIGPLSRQRERREPAGEPAADDRDGAFIDSMHRHIFALRSAECRVGKDGVSTVRARRGRCESNKTPQTKKKN